MPADLARTIRACLRRSDYKGVKTLMSSAVLKPLAEGWAAFKPLEKLVVFKLMDPQLAMEFYERLSFDDRYFLFGGFPLQSIAPVLAGLPLPKKALFHGLPRECYELMYRSLLDDVRKTVRAEAKAGRAVPA